MVIGGLVIGGLVIGGLVIIPKSNFKSNGWEAL